MKIQYTARLFRYSANTTSWFFLRIDAHVGEILKSAYGQTRGWGSIPVTVFSKNISWKTSIFPDKDKTYLLPIKKEVRKIEKLAEGSEFIFEIEV